MQTLQPPAPRLYPRITLLHCQYCGGTGKYRTVIAGKWTERNCTQCNGRGSVVGES